MIDDSIKIKDPDETLAFGFSWEDWLSEDEIILNHEISSSGSELVITNDYHTSSSVIFLASGGVNRTRYSVLCTIETSASQIAQRTMKIDIKNR